MNQMWQQQGVPIPRTRKALQYHVTRIWHALRGREVCINLIGSMFRRLQQDEIISNATVGHNTDIFILLCLKCAYFYIFI